MGFIGFFTGAVSGAPFVPTGSKTVEKMIRFANIKASEKVYDLGCGDGRIVFEASRLGANAVGIEISFPVYWFALLRKKIFKEKGEIRRGSLWDVDISDADVIFVYLLPKMMKRFSELKISTLQKGTRIISHGFELPGYTPVEIIAREGSQGRILKYIV